MKRTVYRTSGSSLALYLAFDLAFLAIPIVSLSGLIRSFSNGDITYIIGDLASLFLVFYLTAHLFTNQIVLTDDSILLKEADSKLFYRCKTIDIPLKEIKTIYLGDKKYLLNELRDKRDGVKEFYSYYERFESIKPKTNKKSRIKIPPVMMLETVKEKYYAFGSRPYPKSKLTKIFDQLKSLGVCTSIQKDAV